MTRKRRRSEKKTSGITFGIQIFLLMNLNRSNIQSINQFLKSNIKQFMLMCLLHSSEAPVLSCIPKIHRKHNTFAVPEICGKVIIVWMSDESAHWFIVSILQSRKCACVWMCLWWICVCVVIYWFFPYFPLRVCNHTLSLAISLMRALFLSLPSTTSSSLCPFGLQTTFYSLYLFIYFAFFFFFLSRLFICQRKSTLHYWKIFNCNLSWHSIRRKTCNRNVMYALCWMFCWC